MVISYNPPLALPVDKEREEEGKEKKIEVTFERLLSCRVPVWKRHITGS